MIDLNNTSRETLRVDEVQNICGVSRRTVYYWIEKQNVDVVICFGSPRITVESVRRHVDAHPYLAVRRESVQSRQQSA